MSGCGARARNCSTRMLSRRAGTVMPPLPPDMPTEQINQLVDYLMTLKGKPGGCGEAAGGRRTHGRYRV